MHSLIKFNVTETITKQLTVLIMHQWDKKSKKLKKSVIFFKSSVNYLIKFNDPKAIKSVNSELQMEKIKKRKTWFFFKRSVCFLININDPKAITKISTALKTL